MCCRWIKFEEDVEEGGERWSKPHVATLSLHSLFELRKGILSGTVMLDLDATNIMQITGTTESECLDSRLNVVAVSERLNCGGGLDTMKERTLIRLISADTRLHLCFDPRK